MAEARKGAGRPQGAPAQPGMGVSGRGYDRMLRVARTIADVAGALQKPGFWLAIPVAAW